MTAVLFPLTESFKEREKTDREIEIQIKRDILYQDNCEK